MDRGVDRVAFEAGRAVLGVEQEGIRAERQLEEMVDRLPGRREAQPAADLPEASGGQPAAARQLHVLGVESVDDLPDPLLVLWIALEVLAVLARVSSYVTVYTSSMGRPIGDRPPVMNDSRRPSGAIDR